MVLRRTSADSNSENNQVNLAVKGIIAIEAMSKIASVVGNSDDASSFSVCYTLFPYSSSGSCYWTLLLTICMHRCKL